MASFPTFSSLPSTFSDAPFSPLSPALGQEEPQAQEAPQTFQPPRIPAGPFGNPEEFVTYWQPSTAGLLPQVVGPDSRYQAIEDSLYRPRTSRYRNVLTLKLPCEAIFRAIGLRLSAGESATYYPSIDDGDGKTTTQFDSSRKRGVAKYFKCIIYYKGGMDDECKFHINHLKRCPFYIQVYENPANSIAPPRGFDFGALRPTVFRNPRAALMDAQQMYESFGIDAPEASASIAVRSPPHFAGFQGTVPLRTRRLYKRRPESAAVTNTAFKQLFILGTGLPFDAYHDMELHEDLNRDKLIRTLDELSAITAKEQRVVYRQLESAFPLMHAACIPKAIEYDRPADGAIEYPILRSEPYQRDNVSLLRFSNIDAWKRRIVGTPQMVERGVPYPDFRVPSWGVTNEFQRIIDYNNRRNIEDAQTTPDDLKRDPVVQNYAMIGKTRDTYDVEKLRSTRRIREMRFQPQHVLQQFYDEQVSRPVMRFPAIYGPGYGG